MSVLGVATLLFGMHPLVVDEINVYKAAESKCTSEVLIRRLKSEPRDYRQLLQNLLDRAIMVQPSDGTLTNDINL